MVYSEVKGKGGANIVGVFVIVLLVVYSEKFKYNKISDSEEVQIWPTIRTRSHLKLDYIPIRTSCQN